MAKYKRSNWRSSEGGSKTRLVKTADGERYVTKGSSSRAQRRAEAEQRQAERDKRTDQEQITLLESRGHPACREVFKLRARITSA